MGCQTYLSPKGALTSPCGKLFKVCWTGDLASTHRLKAMPCPEPAVLHKNCRSRGYCQVAQGFTLTWPIHQYQHPVNSRQHCDMQYQYYCTAQPFNMLQPSGSNQPANGQLSQSTYGERPLGANTRHPPRCCHSQLPSPVTKLDARCSDHSCTPTSRAALSRSQLVNQPSLFAEILTRSQCLTQPSPAGGT